MTNVKGVSRLWLVLVLLCTLLAGASANLGVPALNGRVYIDENCNGIVDPSDTVLTGIQVTLFDITDPLNPINVGTSTTGGSFFSTTDYFFVNFPGFGSHPQGGRSYRIVLGAIPAGYVSNASIAGTFGVSETPGTITVSFPANSTVTSGSHDFLICREANLAGRVYIDTNCNGVIDAGDERVTSLPITLDNGTSTVTGSTDGTGRYLFTRPTIEAGNTYTVKLGQIPAGYYLASVWPATNGTAVDGNTGIRVALPADFVGTSETHDFLLRPNINLNGEVYIDNDGSGTLTPGDELYTASGGATVTLTGGPAPVPQQADNGDFDFATPNVLPGNNYSLTLTVPEGYEATGSVAAPKPGAPASSFSSTRIDVQVASNFCETSGTHRFFIRPIPTIVSVSLKGRVYIDLNCNGQINVGEYAVDGVKITLFDSAGQPVGASKTGDEVSNQYWFSSQLVPGQTYTARMTLPTGYTGSNAFPGTWGGSTPNVISITFTVPFNPAVTDAVNYDFLICRSGRFTTFTQGGWGSKPNGSNPGTLLRTHFPTVFPTGLEVGRRAGVNTTWQIKLTSQLAVQNFLPQGGSASILTKDLLNPTTKNNVLAGQVTAMRLSLAFSDAGILTQFLGYQTIASGPFAGRTAYQLLNIAERVLGGDLSALPSGVSLSQLNDAVTRFNENYVDGLTNKGFLVN